MSSSKRSRTVDSEAENVSQAPPQKVSRATPKCSECRSNDPPVRCSILSCVHTKKNEFCRNCTSHCTSCLEIVCPEHERFCAFCEIPAVHCPRCVRLCTICKGCICDKHVEAHAAFCCDRFQYLSANPPAVTCVHKPCSTQLSLRSCNATGLHCPDNAVKLRLQLKPKYKEYIVGEIRHCHDSVSRYHIWLTLDTSKSYVIGLIRSLMPLPKHAVTQAPCMPRFNLYDLPCNKKHWDVVSRTRALPKDWPVNLNKKWIQSLARGCDMCDTGESLLAYPLFELFERTDRGKTGYYSKLSKTFFNWCYLCPEGHVCLSVSRAGDD